MPKVTNAMAAARREQVAELWAKGHHIRGIARALGVDWETVRRDLAVLAKQAAAEIDVPQELHRLLLAGKAVEADAWDRGRPLHALAAQRQQLAVLSLMLGLDVERRLAEVEARLDAAQGVNPWASPHMQAEARRN